MTTTTSMHEALLGIHEEKKDFVRKLLQTRLNKPSTVKALHKMVKKEFGSGLSYDIICELKKEPAKVSAPVEKKGTKIVLKKAVTEAQLPEPVIEAIKTLRLYNVHNVLLHPGNKTFIEMTRHIAETVTA